MRVAIIDDGVNKKHIPNIKLRKDLIVTELLKVENRTEPEMSHINHGTACAALINKYSPCAEIVSIKILNDKLKTSQKKLLVALKWCLENNIKLINVSLGTIDCNEIDEINNLINEMYDDGVLIVAACNNEDTYTCPASFINVLGVKSPKKKCDVIRERNMEEGEYYYDLYPISGAEITMKVPEILNVNENLEIRLPNNNSFAAPILTSYANNLLIENTVISPIEIKEKLCEKAKNYREIRNKYKIKYIYNLECCKNASIFHFVNKKLTSLNLNNEIFSTKNLKKIDCTDLCDGFNKVQNWMLKNENKIHDSDTIIFVIDKGVEPYLKDGKYFNRKHLFNKKKIVWIFEEINVSTFNNLPLNSNENIWYPGVYHHFRSEKCKDYKITTPVVVVYNLTEWRKFIKFLQRLRGKFKKDGYYSIVTIDHEKSVLEGLEYASLDINKTGEDLNVSRLQDIEIRYCPDIVLAGINTKDKSENYMNYLENAKSIDLIVLFCGDDNVQIKSKDHVNSKKIIVSSLRKSIERNMKGIPCFSYTKNSNVNDIYFFIKEQLR